MWRPYPQSSVASVDEVISSGWTPSSSSSALVNLSGVPTMTRPRWLLLQGIQMSFGSALVLPWHGAVECWLKALAQQLLQ